MKQLTLSELKKNGIELASFTLRSFLFRGESQIYDSRPITAYVFKYKNLYIVYTYVIFSPLIQKYTSYASAFERFHQFISAMNKGFCEFPASAESSSSVSRR